MKNVLCWFLALSLCLSLAACGDGGADPSDDPADTLAEGMMWVTKTREVYPLGPGCAVTGVARLRDTLLIAGESKEGAPVLALTDCTVESGGDVSIGDAVPLSLDQPDAVDETCLYGVCAGGDGFFYILTGERPAAYTGSDGAWVENEDYAGRYSILQYSEGGGLTGRMRLTGWHADSVKGIAVESGGAVVLYGDSYISLLRWNGDVVRTEKLEEGFEVQSVSCDGQGLVASVFEFGAIQGTFWRIDADSGELTPLTAVFPDAPQSLMEGNWAVTQGLPGEYIASDTARFYALDFEAETGRELLTWNQTRSSMECSYVCRLAENAFVCTVSGRESLLLVFRAAQEYKDRSVVKVALYGSASDQAVTLDALNAAGGDCIYEYTVYSADQLDRLQTEISSQNAPDLILFSGTYNEEPLDTDSDYFEDLYPYLDSDPELSRDSFVPHLLEALSDEGRLTQLWQYIGVYTISARTADVGDGKGLTPEDYIRILEGNENYTSVFFPFMSQKENILRLAADLISVVYTDRETASCSFNSASFADLLRWIDLVGIDEKITEITTDMSEVAAFYEQISTPTRIHAIGENYGEPFTLAGFPLGDERGHYYVSTGIRMAIPVLGSNKEGTWAFIRDQLSFETQYSAQAGDSMPDIPVNLEAMQRLSCDILTEEEAQILFDLFDETTFAANYTDASLREIILSGAQPYFAGDKSLEEAVQQIQSRASMYMAEKYG